MGLGTLRFILSLLVIDAHYGLAIPHVQRLVIEAVGVSRAAYVGPGGIAVSGFFVISGYLIALVLDRKYEDGPRGALGFYASRALRIYPLYWLLFAAYWVALVALGTPPALDAGAIAGNLTLVPYGVLGIVADRNDSLLRNLTSTLLIGPSWTLCYDLVFYLAAPWLFRRKNTTWWMVATGLVYFLAHAVLADPRPPVWYAFFYENGTPYLFMFALGALAWHYRGRIEWPVWTSVASMACVLWLTYAPVGLTNTYLAQLIAGCVFAILVSAIGRRRHARRIDRVLGDLTYATYLLHLPLLVIAQRLALPAPALWGLAGTYLGALLLLFAFELPLDRLRDKVYERRGRTPRARPASAIVPVSVAGAFLAGASVSLAANLLDAGTRVAVTVPTCPASWRCERGEVTFRGPGVVSWAPELRHSRRVVADLELAAGPGDASVALVASDGALSVGITRREMRCRVEIVVAGRELALSADLVEACRTRRIVLDTASMPARVAVDSLWVVDAGAAPVGNLRVVLNATAGSEGTAAVRDVFLTRR